MAIQKVPVCGLGCNRDAFGPTPAGDLARTGRPSPKRKLCLEGRKPSGPPARCWPESAPITA